MLIIFRATPGQDAIPFLFLIVLATSPILGTSFLDTEHIPRTKLISIYLIILQGFILTSQLICIPSPVPVQRDYRTRALYCGTMNRTHPLLKIVWASVGYITD